MVKSILKILNREFGGLHKAALLLAVSTFLSSILALFRDQLLASTFGASRTLDIYYAAFKIPDIMYTFFLSVVSSMVLIPLFLGKIGKSEEEGKKFLNEIFSFFGIIVAFLSAIVFLFVPLLVPILAPGFSEAERLQVVGLARILLLSSIFLGLSNIFSSVIQSYKRFFIYALSPILYNVGIIIGVTFFYRFWGLQGVVLGVALGAFLHMIIQIPSVVRLGFVPKLTSNINFSEIKKVIFMSLPRSIGLFSNQITLFFVTALASLFSAGSIAVFNLSYNLQSVPINIIALSFSVAAFPLMAQSFVNNEKEKFFNYAFSAIRQIVLWSLPVAFLFVVLRAQIVRVIFGYGNFGWVDTKLTAAALAIFSISMVAQSFILFFTRAYFATGKTRRPILINVLGSVLIIIFSYLLMVVIRSSEFFKLAFNHFLRVENVPDTSMLIFPLAYSFGNGINAIVLYKMFKKDFSITSFSVSKMLGQSIIASVLLGVGTYFSLNILDDIFNIKTVFGIIVQGVFSGVVGMTIWAVTLKFLKNKEIEEMISSVKQKFWKEETVLSDPQNLQ